MLVINQWEDAFYSTDGITEVNVSKMGTETKPIFVIFMKIIKEGFETDFKLGKYEKRQYAKFDLMKFYDAIKSDEKEFRMPTDAEIPDLRLMKSKGRCTSIKSNNGGS